MQIASIRRDELAPQPLEKAHALPAAFYVDPLALAFEQDAIFARHWQLVAHVSQLTASGDHVVFDLGRVPCLIVRDADGKLRGFHNVCRHRAGPLASCDGRGAKALRCQYHGWTYTLQGQLRSAPEMNQTQDFDVASIRLPGIAVQTWRGLVFAALDPAIPLSELLQGIGERLGERDFSHYVFDRRVTYDMTCNWKVYVDNYLEGYHVPHIHPTLNQLLDYRSYVTTAHGWHSLQYSPMENAGNFYGEGEAVYFFVWPNFMLNILPARLQTNRVIALGPERCRVEFDYLYPPEQAQDEAARRTQDRRFSDEVQREDGAICTAVQQRLASGAYTPGRLNPKRENALHHFQELIRRTWREAGWPR